MRENWRAVGEALKVGKVKENREPGQKFSEWREESFPGLDEWSARDAMWFSQNFEECTSFLKTHPSDIRAAYNESLRTGPLPIELAEIQPQTTIELDTRSAERVVKLVRRSEAGDEGSALVV